MQKRFFVVEQHSQDFELRELDPQIGHSVQQYGSVSTSEVAREGHCCMFLFIQPPAADSHELAATLYEAVLAEEQVIEKQDSGLMSRLHLFKQ